jgi:WD40 repeat protein
MNCTTISCAAIRDVHRMGGGKVRFVSIAIEITTSWAAIACLLATACGADCSKNRRETDGGSNGDSWLTDAVHSVCKEIDTRETRMVNDPSTELAHGKGFVRAFNGDALRDLRGIRDIEFLRDEQELIGIAGDSDLCVWDWRREKKLRMRKLSFPCKGGDVDRERNLYFVASKKAPYRLLAVNTKDLSISSAIELPGMVTDLEYDEVRSELLIVHDRGVDIWNDATKKKRSLIVDWAGYGGSWGEGGTVALAGNGVELWDVDEKKHLGTIAPDLQPFDVAFLKNGMRLFVCGRPLQRSGAEDHLEVWSIKPQRKEREVPNCGIGVDLVVAGQAGIILQRSEDGLCVVDRVGEVVRKMSSLPSLAGMTISASEDFFAVSGKGIAVFNLGEITIATRRDRLYHSVIDLWIGADGEKVWASDRAATVVWDLNSGVVKKKYPSGGRFCVTIEEELLTLSGSTVNFYDASGLRKFVKTVITADPSRLEVSCSQRSVVGMLSPEPADTEVHVRQLGKNSKKRVLEMGNLVQKRDGEHVVLVDPSGKWLLVWNLEEGRVGRWNFKSLSDGPRVVRKTRKVTHLEKAASRDGRVVVVAYGKQIDVMNPLTLDVRERLKTNGDCVTTPVIALGPNGKKVAVADCGSIMIWNTVQREMTNRYRYVEGGTATSLAFGPHGKYLAAGYGNSEVILWDLAKKLVSEQRSCMFVDTSVSCLTIR